MPTSSVRSERAPSEDLSDLWPLRRTTRSELSRGRLVKSDISILKHSWGSNLQIDTADLIL